ncbi:DUF4352 domain-containing protein [candidate division WS5 bacterium]|uniref:DUF4352 domain-containing protein n=1 Tax=candidate division WS5 bacterium TaxID=2093353 RepID=A0A419DER0_9BACT|nr:MAG: DUF4352 domain-containing protein [candidate division WS5 bacterium]
MANKKSNKNKTEVNGEVTVNIKKKKKWPWVVGGIVLLIIIISVAGSSSQPQKVGETKKENSQNSESQAEEKPSAKTYKVGDNVKLKDNILTVYSVGNYQSENEFMQPQAGKKFIVVDIGLQNDGKEAIDYNVYDFKLQDNQDYSYQQAFATKDPSYGSGALQPAQKTRGFIVFEIPTANTPAQLIYTPSFWSTEQIIVSLQ